MVQVFLSFLQLPLPVLLHFFESLLLTPVLQTQRKSSVEVTRSADPLAATSLVWTKSPAPLTAVAVRGGLACCGPGQWASRRSRWRLWTEAWAPHRFLAHRLWRTTLMCPTSFCRTSSTLAMGCWTPHMVCISLVFFFFLNFGVPGIFP